MSRTNMVASPAPVADALSLHEELSALETSRRRFFLAWLCWTLLGAGLVAASVWGFVVPGAWSAESDAARILTWTFALGWLPAAYGYMAYLHLAVALMGPAAEAIAQRDGSTAKAPSFHSLPGRLALVLSGARSLGTAFLYLPQERDRRSGLWVLRATPLLVMTLLSGLLFEVLALAALADGPGLTLVALAHATMLLLGLEIAVIVFASARGLRVLTATDPAALLQAPLLPHHEVLPHERGWLRENLEALIIAVIIALVIRQFCLEAFQIPTGSMKPTLMGAQPGESASQGDRILVNKFAYQWRDPQRWEVVVFKYPLQSQKNFIKRLIGLPGETLRVKNGDIYRKRDGRFEILRKPESVRRSTWMPAQAPWGLYDSRREKRLLTFTSSGDAPARAHWDAGRFADRWSESPGEADQGPRLELRTPPSGQTAWLVFQDPGASGAAPDSDFEGAFDEGERCLGMVTRGDERNLCGDVRLGFDYRLDQGAMLTWRLDEEFGGVTVPPETVAITCSLGRSGAGRYELRIGEKIIAAGALRLGRALPETGRLVFWHLDDAFGLSFSTHDPDEDWRAEPFGFEPDGGDPVTQARYDYEPLFPTVRVGLRVGAWAAKDAANTPGAEPKAVFSRLVLRRDLYYTTQAQTLLGESPDNGKAHEVVFQVPKASFLDIAEPHYFCMGDNSHHSKDSRVWFQLELRLRDGRVIRTDAVPDDDDQQITQIVPLLDGLGIRRGSELGRRVYEAASRGEALDLILNRADLEAAAQRAEREQAQSPIKGPPFSIYDIFGRRQRFEAGDIVAARVHPGHFVPRSYFVGKALVVFWPLDSERLKVIR